VHNSLKDIVQDCHLSILVGSGLSMPYLKTLGNIENLLTELDAHDDLSRDHRKLIKAALYKKYFSDVVAKNVGILTPGAAAQSVLDQYRSFFQALSDVLLRRKTPILSKEANVFTTNVDIFMEKALEDLQLEYNDGFSGRFRPTFSLTNFRRSLLKRSLHYDNMSEVPVFNLCKLHGSASWELSSSGIAFSPTLAHISEVANLSAAAVQIATVPDGADLPTIIGSTAGAAPTVATNAFLEGYERLLLVVNPTKEKFKHTLLNQTYYELLRIYSNELEKENAFLMVLGFSFADEHIREITIRATSSNPTLLVWVVAYSAASAADLSAKLNVANAPNRNIRIIAPTQAPDATGTPVDEFQYDFSTINAKLTTPLRADVIAS
jgi:hypothetical protein